MMTQSMAQRGLISQEKPGLSDNVNNLLSQSTRLYIQNLPAYVETNRLREHFASKGEVTDAIVVKTKDGSKSRRFGFIGYKTHEHAKAAKEFFHQSFLDTCKINVQFAVAKASGDIPRPWSKYSAGSSRFEGSNNSKKEVEEEKKNEVVEPKKTKEPASGKEEDTAEFKEFMETMQARSKTRFWANDDGIDGAKDMSKVLHDDSSDDDNDDDDEEEEYQDLDTIVKKKLNESKKEMSDIDFLRSKMKQTVSEDEDIEEDDSEEDMEEDKKESVNEKKGHPSQDQAAKPSARLFVRNLPYTAVEEDLTDLFSGYGEVLEVHMPLDDTKRRKGFGFVLFKNTVDAQAAMDALNGFSFQGRVLHVLPSKESHQNLALAQQQDDPNLTYKQKKEIERQQNANTKTGWNAAFIRGDATVGSLAERMGVKRGDIMDKEHGNMAVRLAIGETMLVKENKDFFAEEGIDLDAIESAILKTKASGDKTKIERSIQVILIKNLPHTTEEEELSQLFCKFGDLARFLLAPSKTLALVEFLEPSEARKAFRSLAYKKYQHVPLYLEWAPLKVFTKPVSKTTNTTAVEGIKSSKQAVLETFGAEESSSTQADGSDETSQNTLCIKNLNFVTTESTLEKLFCQCGKIRKVTIAKKKDPKKPNQKLSMGFGFVEFNSHQDASNAIKSFQSTVVDGHAINLKFSQKKLVENNTKKRKANELGGANTKQTKIIVRNVAFEATINEIRELFGAFGQLKKVRMPKKFDGRHRGFAFVEFLTEQEALNAYSSLTSSHLYGRHLVLEWAKPEDDLETLRAKASKDLSIVYESSKREKRLRLATGEQDRDEEY